LPCFKKSQIRVEQKKGFYTSITPRKRKGGIFARVSASKKEEIYLTKRKRRGNRL